MLLKIGQLAGRSGLTIRALRHYDDIGLLSPSLRSAGGYRLYDGADVARLYRIQALRRLDLPLAEIQAILAGGGAGPAELVGQQIAFLDRQITRACELRRHLRQLQGQLDGRGEPGIDDWLAALEGMVAGAKYFTSAELADMTLRRERGAADRGVEKAALLAELQELIARGAAPQEAPARALAQRWIGLLLDEVGGDEGLLMKLYAMHWNEPRLHALSGVGHQGMQFIAEAMAHNRLEMYATYCEPDEMARLGRVYVGQTAAWPPLICAIRAQLALATPPGSAAMQALARDWCALSLAKAAGDPRLQAKLQAAFEAEPALRAGSGIDASLLTFINQAISRLDAG